MIVWSDTSAELHYQTEWYIFPIRPSYGRPILQIFFRVSNWKYSLIIFSLSISVYTKSWLLEEKVSNFRQTVEMLTFAHVSDSSK